MPQLSRGQKVRLADLSPSLQLRAGIGATSSTLSFDISCFGLDQSAQLSDDRYFIFYNQPASPEGALHIVTAQAGDAQTFDLDLSRLPASVQRLVFVLTIDGDGEMRNLQSGYFRLDAQGQEIARFPFMGQDFQTEKAVMVAEIYLKDVWRVDAVGQGFAGGLPAVLEHFGGEEAEEAPALPPTPQPAQRSTPAPTPPSQSHPAPVSSPTVSLNKDEQLRVKLEKKAPQLVNLSKTLAISLQKQGLSDIVARVALVLDASGSMTSQYEAGSVQGVVDRIATLAMRLDDDGELDTWGFASRHQKLPSVTLDNVNGYVKRITKGSSMLSIIGKLGISNNEPPVMKEVLNTYRTSRLPALVIFISDGGVCSSDPIQKLLIEASKFPIFWQFVGLGGNDYGILEDLDTMPGRAVDNASFFHVDDLESISDAQLYDRLLNEFPKWITEAKRMGIVK